MIHVGTSGFSYDDWKGPFYPPGLPKGKMFDFYAERFAAVEINATFYGTPPPRTVESLVRRARGRVIFAAKAPAIITHEGILEQATVAAFQRALEPIRAADRLGAILLQFPQRFHWTAGNARYIERALAAFGDAPTVVEIRHASWQREAPLAWFRERRINLCMMDMPRLRGLPSPALELTGPIAYVRFHGRNAEHWHGNGELSDARYDYLYSREQVEQWIEPLRDLERRAETTFAFFNNHPRAEAARNAATLLEMLGRPIGRAGQLDIFLGQ